VKPKSIRGAIQQMLPEIEEMLSLGVAREEIYKEVAKRYGFESIKIGSFDLALHRARVKAKANQSSSGSVLHNTDRTETKETVLHKTGSSQSKDVLHNTEKSNPSGNVLHNTQSNPGITTQEEINKIHSEIDYSEFKTKKY